MRHIQKIFWVSLTTAALVAACELRDTERVRIQKEPYNSFVEDPDPPGTRLKALLDADPVTANRYQVQLDWNGWLRDETEIYRSRNQEPAVLLKTVSEPGGEFFDEPQTEGKYTYFLKVKPLDGKAGFESLKAQVEVPLDFVFSPGAEVIPPRRKYGRLFFEAGARILVPREGLVLIADEILNAGATILYDELTKDAKEMESALFIRAKKASGAPLLLEPRPTFLPPGQLASPVVYVRIDELNEPTDIMGPRDIVSGCLRLGRRQGRAWREMGCSEIEKYFETELLKKVPSSGL